MKRLIALEEAAIFAACVYAFSLTGWAWWWFPALLLLPDLSMLGYAFGPRAGAASYNLLHHRVTPLAIGIAGVAFSLPMLQLACLVGLAHISMDRALGYGLKTSQGFKYTHLGQL